jgi:hypothetical protein
MKTKKILSFLVVITLLLNLFIIISATKVEGPWYYYTDKADGGTSKVIINGKEVTKFKFLKENIDGKEREVAVLKGEVTMDFQYGFLGMGVKIEGAGKDIIKNAKGIKFKVATDSTSKCRFYRCRLETSNVKDFDYYGKRFKVDTTPKEITVKFSEITQQGWGKKVGFNKKLIFQISFQTEGQPYEKVVLKIWDLEIIE